MPVIAASCCRLPPVPAHRFMQSLISGKPYPLNPEEPLGLFVIILLVYCVIFLAAIHINGWVLTKNLGRAMIGAHLAFCVLAIVITFSDL